MHQNVLLEQGRLSQPLKSRQSMQRGINISAVQTEDNWLEIGMCRKLKVYYKVLSKNIL